MTTITDSLGVEFRLDDVVRVLAWGAPVRLCDVGCTAEVVRITHRGNVVLRDRSGDPIARGRAVSPGMLGILDRSDRDNRLAAGYEGNRDLYATTTEESADAHR